MVPQALLNVGIRCRGNGSGYEEFTIMDKDFNNYVRFKDFCKFVKNHNKGKAYTSGDSSASDSGIFDEIMTQWWKDIDPERRCYVTLDHLLAWASKQWDFAAND